MSLPVWRSWVLMLLLWLFSGNAFAQETVSGLQDDNCGVEFGKVIPGDGTLCREDLAFGMLYEMFPSIFNELTPMWNLTSFRDIAGQPNTPTLLGEYRGDQIFYSLFDFFYDLIFLCIMVYGGAILLSIIARLLRGDTLTDKDSAKDGPASWAIGLAMGGGFLVPFKQFFLGQIVVFSFGIASLSMVNFTYSLFLSGNQAMFESISDPTLPAQTGVAPGVQERHDFLASSYYRYLTRMQLCRRQSSAYIMSGEGARFLTPEVYRQAQQCSAGQGETGYDVAATWEKDDQAPPFMWSQSELNSEHHGGRVLYGAAQSVTFASRSSDAAACAVEDEAIPDYTCGKIEINQPDWSLNPLVRLLPNTDTIQGHLEALQQQLSPTDSAGTIETIVSERWELLRKDLMRGLVEAWEAKEADANDPTLIAQDNQVVRRSDALRSALLDNARPHFQQAAQFFHQSAMNVLMFGQTAMHLNLEDPNSTSRRFTVNAAPVYWGGISHYAEQADAFADLVERAQCSDYRHDLSAANATLQFLLSESDVLPGGAHARCLTLDGREVMEFDPDYGTKEHEALRQEAMQRFEALRNEFRTQWATNIQSLASQRRAIENSFETAINDDRQEQWWITMRQKGYLSAADYAQNINQRVNGYKRALKQVVNNFYTIEPNIDNRYISRSLEDRYSVDDLFVSFAYAGDEVFYSTRALGNRIDPIVSNAQWIAEQEQVIRQRPLEVDSTDIFYDIVRAFSMPKTYLDRLGIGTQPGDKDPELCMEDPRRCPFPLSDPIVELSLLGHDMVDVSVGFFASAVPIKMLSGKNFSRMREGQQKGTVGNAEGKVFDALTKNRILGGLGTVVSGAVSIAGFMDMIYDLLSTIMVGFLVIGGLLAYLLPLVPKIYLYLGYISWLTVLVMASFSVLLWSLFWVRFREKRDLLKSAGFHFGVELLFKPTFNLIAVIFAWYFFYVVAFSIGVGVGWVWQLPVHGEGNFLRPYVDTLVVILLVLFTYMVGLRYAYQLMDDLSGELLKKLGVNHQSSKDKVSEFIKVMLFDHAKRAVEGLNKKASQNFGRDAAKRDMMDRLSSAQEGAARFNKAYAQASSGNSASQDQGGQ